jgi:iron complex outermembrane receptor protein
MKITKAPPHLFVLSAMGAALLLLCDGAAAQVAAPDAAASASAGNAGAAPRLERVIITAQKREQVLQDVPLAVSEISGKKLESLQIDNIEQLRFVVPSFDSTAAGISVRGVGTASFSVSIEQSVSTVVDDVVLGRPEMSRGSFYDLARVEVLRGPQGMLFGKNASAGLVSITTQQAKLGVNEGQAFASAGNGGYLDANATVNLALGESAALRVGGYHNSLDGVIINRPDGRRLNGNQEDGTRLRFTWAPHPDVRVHLGADYNVQDTSGLWVPFKTNPTGAQQIGLAACGITASSENRETCLDGPAETNIRNEGVTARVDWTLGNFTVTSVTAQRKNDYHDNRDSDSLPVNILNLNSNDQAMKQFSQELRLGFDGSGSLRATGGLYFFKLDNLQQTVQGGTLGLAPVPVFNSTINSDVGSRSTAVFGQAEYDITPKLTAILGARRTRDELTMEFDQRAAPGSVPFQAVVKRSDATSASSTSWRLGAMYRLMPDLMVYAMASRGYKGPGFNQTAVANATTSQLVNPEVPSNFELGMRGTFLDGRLQANVTAFQQNFKGYQAQVLDTSVFPAAIRTVNAGQLDTRGLEADITAVLPQRVLLTAAVAYLDANYKDFGQIACYPGQTVAEGCLALAPGFSFFNPTGSTLAGVSRWRATLGASHQRQITAALTAYLAADFSWRSSFNTSATRDPNTVIEAYGLVNASVGIGAANDAWRLTLWGKNLADKNYAASIFGSPFGDRRGGDYAHVPTIDSARRLGVSLNLRF